MRTSLRHAAAFRTGILAVVAAVLAVRGSRLAGTGSGWRPDARNEKRFYGWGYGAELGGTWATLFPTTVRAAVFDGAPDPNADDLMDCLDIRAAAFRDPPTLAPPRLVPPAVSACQPGLPPLPTVPS